MPSDNCAAPTTPPPEHSTAHANFTSCPLDEERTPLDPLIAARVRATALPHPFSREHATSPSPSDSDSQSGSSSREADSDTRSPLSREHEKDAQVESSREAESDARSRTSGDSPDSAIAGISVEKAEHVEHAALSPPIDLFSPSPVSSPREGGNESDVKLAQSLATTALDVKQQPKEDDDNTRSEDTTAPLYLYYPPLDNQRPHPHTHTSFLRPGSKFKGTQTSDRQVYDVQVEIKSVDLLASTLCGYLRIQGLTDDHPTLTTFFEGEIIGPKHLFRTSHASWNSSEKIDLQHWARFPAWRPLAKSAKASSSFTLKNHLEREHLFMRWKEYFLVPDHRVKSISGASFEGFYYICFDQTKGSVSGIYFHAKSEKYQQLELVHVEDGGCFGAVEFR